MPDRRFTAALVVLSLVACSGAKRPATTATATPTPAPVAPSLPDGIDGRALADWWQENAERVRLNQSAAAGDLAVTVNLIDWIAKGDEEAWERMEATVERAYADPNQTLKPAVVVDDAQREEARRYHEAARPFSSRPRGERDPVTELRLYGKALLLNPGDGDLHNHLAIARSLERRFDLAIRHAKLAIAVDPSFLSAYQELAYAYKNAERYEEVIPVADRGLEIDGDLRTKALLLARKGQAYWMLGREREALNAFGSSRRLGGPGWVQSYLDGEQTLGEEYREPSAER